MNRALSSVGVGILCGMVTACAGGDTPARDGELVQFVSQRYGSGQVGAVGGSGGNGGSGTSGSNSGSSGDGGDSGSSGDGGDSGSSGDGGSTAANGGDGGDGGSEAMGGDGGSDPGGCDGFMILQNSCGTGSCHGAGSGFSDFAASETAAAQWVGEPGQSTCNGNPAPIFDPDDPSGSMVIIKLGASPPCGGQMPITSPGSITPDQIACIEDFISGL